MNTTAKDLETFCPKKPLLTLQEAATLLECDPKTIRNWTKRSDPSKRPPRLIIGREVRFPAREFCQWIVKQQHT